MDYSVYAYLTDSKEVKAVFGSKSPTLYNEIKSAFNKEMEYFNDEFEEYITPRKNASTVLADIIDGKITYRELNFLYGYIYEKICRFYGKIIYNAPGLWHLDKQSAFIPIPFSDDFPYIISIPVSQLEEKKKQYTALKEGQGIGDYDYEQEMDDLKFIFDEAIEAQKDLVIMVY